MIIPPTPIISPVPIMIATSDLDGGDDSQRCKECGQLLPSEETGSSSSREGFAAVFVALFVLWSVVTFTQWALMSINNPTLVHVIAGQIHWANGLLHRIW